MNAKLLIIFCLSLFLIISLANAEEGPGGGGETDYVEAESSEDLQQAIDNGDSANIPEGTTVDYNGVKITGPASYSPESDFDVSESNPITGPNGNKYAGSGMQIENGQVKNAEDFKVQTSEGSAEGKNTQNMQFNGDDYSLDLSTILITGKPTPTQYSTETAFSAAATEMQPWSIKLQYDYETTF